MKEPIRTSARLSDEQRGLLAWAGIGSGDENLDRLRDHVVLLADSLRLSLDREAQARQMLQAWLDNFGYTAESADIGPCLARDTKRWLGEP